MITIKDFLLVRVVREVQEGRRTSVGLDAKHGSVNIGVIGSGLQAQKLTMLREHGEDEVVLTEGDFDMSYAEIVDQQFESEMTVLREKIFVVIEGPDCSGKTTLIARLEELFDLKSEKNLRMTSHKEMTAAFAEDLVFNHPRKTKVGILKDRWQYPSDIIYEEIHGRKPSRLLEWEPTLIRQFVEGNVLFLYVKASPDELIRRLGERGDEEMDEAKLRAAALVYESFFRTRTDLPSATIDTTNMTEEEVAYTALDLIMRHYKEELK